MEKAMALNLEGEQDAESINKALRHRCYVVALYVRREKSCFWPQHVSGKGDASSLIESSIIKRKRDHIDVHIPFVGAGFCLPESCTPASYPGCHCGTCSRPASETGCADPGARSHAAVQ